MIVGAALFLCSGYMVLVPGHLKKVYEDWMMHPQHGSADEAYAARNWAQVEAFQNDHPILWELAPLFPPYGWHNQPVWFTLLFVKVNWRFLVYLVLLCGSAGMAISGYELQKLVDQLNHEDRLEKMRIKRRGGVAAPVASGVDTHIEIRNEIEVKASETGKWYSLNGAIVGGSVATILGTVVLKWLGVIS